MGEHSRRGISAVTTSDPLSARGRLYPGICPLRTDAHIYPGTYHRAAGSVCELSPGSRASVPGSRGRCARGLSLVADHGTRAREIIVAGSSAGGGLALSTLV